LRYELLDEAYARRPAIYRLFYCLGRIFIHERVRCSSIERCEPVLEQSTGANAVSAITAAAGCAAFFASSPAA
jgi:hypothetical protein